MAKSSPPLPEWHQIIVGRRLKAAHLAKGWDSKTFSDMLKGDVTPQKLSNWENGHNLVPIDVAIRAGTLTGLDIRFFFEGRLPSNIDPDYAVKISQQLNLIDHKPQRKLKRA